MDDGTVGLERGGLLAAAERGRLGDRGTLVVAGVLAALVFAVAAILSGGMPVWTRVPSAECRRRRRRPRAWRRRGAWAQTSALSGPRGHPGELLTVNRAQRMRAAFTAGGVRVSVPGRQRRPVAAGRRPGGSLQAATPVRPVARANRVTYARGSLTEWYANGPLGLEQGLTLRAPPARRQRSAAT